MSNRRIAFRNARLIDPASGLDAKGGLLVENGRIADVGPRLFAHAATQVQLAWNALSP